MIEEVIEDIERKLNVAPHEMPDPYPDDLDATWVYWTSMDTAERGIPTEWVWERLRNRRNVLLAECDFRVVPDAPWDAAPWLAYRQALRELPDNTADPRVAVWPEPPQ